MVIFKFEKTSTAALAAHVDTLRTVTYILRRANLNVEYSQGYNPHMELVFSPPLALGVQSFCEYVGAKMEHSDGLLQKINAVCPAGIRFVKVFNKQMNLAAKINRATYQIEAKGLGDVAEQILAENYQISYEEKGNTVTKNVASRIFNAQKLNADAALVTLAVGNENLRPDRLVRHLMQANGLTGDYNVTKTQSFVDETPVDDYIEGLQQ